MIQLIKIKIIIIIIIIITLKRTRSARKWEEDGEDEDYYKCF